MKLGIECVLLNDSKIVSEYHDPESLHGEANEDGTIILRLEGVYHHPAEDKVTDIIVTTVRVVISEDGMTIGNRDWKLRSPYYLKPGDSFSYTLTMNF